MDQRPPPPIDEASNKVLSGCVPSRLPTWMLPLAAVARTDREGLFRVEGLSSGLKYELQLRRAPDLSAPLVSDMKDQTNSG